MRDTPKWLKIAWVIMIIISVISIGITFYLQNKINSTISVSKNDMTLPKQVEILNMENYIKVPTSTNSFDLFIIQDTSSCSSTSSIIPSSSETDTSTLSYNQKTTFALQNPRLLSWLLILKSGEFYSFNTTIIDEQRALYPVKIGYKKIPSDAKEKESVKKEIVKESINYLMRSLTMTGSISVSSNGRDVKIEGKKITNFQTNKKLFTCGIVFLSHSYGYSNITLYVNSKQISLPSEKECNSILAIAGF